MYLCTGHAHNLFVKEKKMSAFEGKIERLLIFTSIHYSQRGLFFFRIEIQDCNNKAVGSTLSSNAYVWLLLNLGCLTSQYHEKYTIETDFLGQSCVLSH